MPTIVAKENPELAQALIEQHLAQTEEAVNDAVPQARAVSELPPDTHVDLPGGYIIQKGELMGEQITEAEVRELNGFDEEELSKTATALKRIDTLLARGVVKVGDLTPNPELFNRMLVGDREALVLAIRCATYGETATFTDVRCDSCGAIQDVEVDLTKHVPVSRLDSPTDRNFEVTLRRGTASVSLPDGFCQSAVLAKDGLTEAERSTVLLKHCVESINGFPILDENSIRALSIRDRATLVAEITKRSPGPHLERTKVPCPQCEEDILMPINLLGLFQA